MATGVIINKSAYKNCGSDRFVKYFEIQKNKYTNFKI